jgi:two-component system sensor histidine kinase/response regulator
MPVMDGHQATLALRRMPRFAELPILAMTAHAMQDEAARCLEEGMNAHLTKPIDMQALTSSLARWGNVPAQTGAAAQTEPAPLPAAAAALPALTIPGIDVAQGLVNCAGKLELYTTLLRHFSVSLQATPQRVRQALADTDCTTARRAAHTLKGVALNLGAAPCAKSWEAIESLLKDQAGLTVLEIPLAEAEQEAIELARHILAVLGNPPRASAPESVKELKQLADICAQLAALLAQNNGQAQVLLQEHAALLAGGLGDGFGLLQQKVEQFDYEEALQALHQAAKVRGVQLA